MAARIDMWLVSLHDYVVSIVCAFIFSTPPVTASVPQIVTRKNDLSITTKHNKFRKIQFIHININIKSMASASSSPKPAPNIFANIAA